MVRQNLCNAIGHIVILANQETEIAGNPHLQRLRSHAFRHLSEHWTSFQPFCWYIYCIFISTQVQFSPVKVLEHWLGKDTPLVRALLEAVHGGVVERQVIAWRRRPVHGAGFWHTEDLLWRHLQIGDLLQVGLGKHWRRKLHLVKSQMCVVCFLA